MERLKAYIKENTWDVAAAVACVLAVAMFLGSMFANVPSNSTQPRVNEPAERHYVEPPEPLSFPELLANTVEELEASPEYQEIVKAKEALVEELRDAATDCGELSDEILADLRCINVDHCTMTRDEMVASEARFEAFMRYCPEHHAALGVAVRKLAGQ